MESGISGFVAELPAIARPAGQGSYAFVNSDGTSRGFVQFILHTNQITIHRIWTRQPGTGNGGYMLRALCDLADRHQVQLSLKPLPIGRKPYPLNSDQLLAWYQRYGFAGTRRKLIRPPLPAKSVRAQPSAGSPASGR